ncbi:MAG: cation-transporting P-type ATPase [Deltaproteobacteria bacterium]|nr:cation-transporting P-type ATPase [Deltaproteobacteria bacterium]
MTLSTAEETPQLVDHPWSLEAGSVASRLDTDPVRGLTRKEARQRLTAYGPNRLRVRGPRPAWRILVAQFSNLIIGLLAGAGAMSLLSGQTREALAIGAAILLNALIGFFTELRARRSLESLRKLGQPKARVIREGRVSALPVAKLAPGDLVELEAGEVVPADLRVLEANRLEVDESALTGESLPVTKDPAPVDAEALLAERSAMLWKGTSLATGSARGLVTATGAATELGRVARLTEEAAGEGPSPLQQRLTRLGRRLIWVTLAVALAVGLMGWLAGRPLLLIVETAVALAVAAIPEGLPMVATIALARGMWRLARQHAVLNRLAAVETLGSTTLICTDKTGTLTLNQMDLATLVLPGPEGLRRWAGREDLPLAGDPGLRLALEAGVLCVNASLDEDGRTLGDPLEGALLRAGRRAGLERSRVLREWPEEREDAFDPKRKMMATYHAGNKGGWRVAVKGAPEAVLAASEWQGTPDDQEPLDETARRSWDQANQDLAAQGLRVIALAERQSDQLQGDPYHGLVFLGLAGLWDPPREDAAEAIEACRRAGIRVIMITGDQEATARYVGRELGLLREGGKVLTGRDLAPPEELDEAGRQRIREAAILARVSPEQKLDLIALHQEAGEVVAMTGDGVNDAPALKKADIGVAMGERGTQVAKEAADMVLLDDALGSILAAVRQGRAIFANIRKFIIYLLSGNIAEILSVSLAIVAGWPLPLLPLQILYLNMLGDVFPALALGVGRGGPKYLEQPPRRTDEPVLTSGHWWAILGWGGLIAAVNLAGFGLALRVLGMPQDQAVTVSFLSLAFARVWHVFNMRGPAEPLLVNQITTNPAVWGALALCAALLLAAQFVPGLREVLGMTPLPAAGWALVALGSLLPLGLGQALLGLAARSGA